jgi:hypothetical protein
MPDVNEFHAAVATQGIDRRVERITDDAIASASARCVQQFPHGVGNILTHRRRPK